MSNKFLAQRRKDAKPGILASLRLGVTSLFLILSLPAMLCLPSNGATNNWTNTAGWYSSVPHDGDTVVLWGTFNTNLALTSSGTNGTITVRFAAGAMFSAPTLPEAYSLLTLDGMSNIVIDGGVNGLMQLTDNGTLIANGGACHYQNQGLSAIHATGINNVTIQNLTISNIYNRATNTEAALYPFGDGNGIYWQGSGLTVSNCFLTGSQEMISGVYGNPATSNLVVTYCVLSNFNHGIVLGAGTSPNPFFTNVTITHNTFQGGDMYEEGGTNDLGLHRNPIFVFNTSSSGCVYGMTLAYNFITMGAKPQSVNAGSGAMYFDCGEWQTQHVRIYNNISTLTAPLVWAGGNGLVSCCGNDVLVANNTAVMWQSNGIYGGAGGGCQMTICGTNVSATNNIVISAQGLFVQTDPSSSQTSWTLPLVAQYMAGVSSDYNLYNGQQGSSFQVTVLASNLYTSPELDTFGAFTNMFTPALGFNFDPHGLTGTLLFSSGFIPAVGSVADKGGANLTAQGITNDYAGNPRPATGPWTIGAYQLAATLQSNVFYLKQ